MDVTLLILAAVTTVLLTALFIDFAIGHGQVRSLKAATPAHAGPPLSIIAAARNEARGIEAAVTSLLRLDYPALEIVIVNDRSTDETGAILERLTRVLSGFVTAEASAKAISRTSDRGPSLKIVTITELPDGWLGKNYALQIGADAAIGELILFTDADIVFEPSALRRAVTLMEEQKVDHLAVIPDIVVPGIALNAFVAAFGVFFSMYARPWKVRDPRSRAHIGVGAFNLIRVEAYRAIGGHRAIAMRPDDDMKLGKLVKKHGFRQDVAVGRDMLTVEWYASVGEMIDGLMKNAFAGVDYSLWKVVASSVALFLMNVWPFLAVFLTSGTTRALNAVSVLLIALIFWTVNGTRVAYVLAFPAAALLFIYIMWRSALIAVVSGKITWRGTAYPLSQMRANRI
jgi:cellulose synthase/poly-beta-1,6-N-acetylglucosamine synthase-like glycosyltransferase